MDAALPFTNRVTVNTSLLAPGLIRHAEGGVLLPSVLRVRLLHFNPFTLDLFEDPACIPFTASSCGVWGLLHPHWPAE